tara:strand:+ start:3005 stop:3139 length:135 start_codon:yes stop_codon:yes gene_type:complete
MKLSDPANMKSVMKRKRNVIKRKRIVIKIKGIVIKERTKKTDIH